MYIETDGTGCSGEAEDGIINCDCGKKCHKRARQARPPVLVVAGSVLKFVDHNPTYHRQRPTSEAMTHCGCKEMMAHYDLAVMNFDRHDVPTENGSTSFPEQLLAKVVKNGRRVMFCTSRKDWSTWATEHGYKCCKPEQLHIVVASARYFGDPVKSVELLDSYYAYDA